jgi:hypothetical protein
MVTGKQIVFFTTGTTHCSKPTTYNVGVLSGGFINKISIDDLPINGSKNGGVE